MKTLFYIMIVLCMSTNLTSCTPEALTNQVEEIATEGEDGEIGGDDDDDGTGNN